MKNAFIGLLLGLSITACFAQGKNDVERRLSGVQHQVTVLHAKLAADEKELERLKHVAVLNGAERNKLETRVEVLEKKVTALVNILKLQQERRIREAKAK